MPGLLSKLALPLLAKELTERAVRKKTYVIRVVFAALLMGGFGVLLRMVMGLPSGVLGTLGSGWFLFRTLMMFQCAGIFLFLPAMTAGQITTEKERDSLALLFLTRLGPWQIVFEKYLSALVPFLSLLLLAMPIAAVAYAYGGVTRADMGEGIYLLLVTSLQLAALSLLCSACCKTAVGALLSTYFLGALLYWLPEFVDGWVSFNIPKWIQVIGPLGLLESGFSRNGFQNYPRRDPLTFLQESTAAWVSVLVYLGLARFFLVRRAFIKGTNPALLVFRWIDRFMQRLNRRTGNVNFGNAQKSLPGAHPIAWRELRRNALAHPRYLTRILVAIEISTVILVILMAATTSMEDLPSLAASLGGLAVLAISVNAANTFVSERVHQTLDLLLTTPMSARQIVEEKARAMRPLLYAAAVPLLTIFLLEWGLDSKKGMLYLVCGALSLLIYVPLVAWLSLWIGLKTKTRLKAIMTALVVLVLWCGVPPMLGLLFAEDRFERIWVWCSLSPVYVPLLNETHLSEMDPLLGCRVVAFNFIFHGALLYYIRRRCLLSADSYLRHA